MCEPVWLPKMLEVSPWYNGSDNDTYEMLYRIFCRDIKSYGLKYNGSDVWIYNEIEDGKEKVFWHLTSRQEKGQKVPRRKNKFYTSPEIPAQRNPDLRRSERLTWVKPLIENSRKSEVLAWDYKEGDGKVKTYIWLKDYYFVVVMKKYEYNRRRLITSFYVDEPYMNNDLERKYQNRII